VTAIAKLDYTRHHLRFGWWSLLVFTTFGLMLELFHGFKVGFYLDVSNETRRLMWTLAHAHGSLLALVHVIFGLSVRAVPELSTSSQRLISLCLTGASLALPGGFFLGGVVVHGGDPSVGILLVPVGATLLLIAIFQLARQAGSVHPHESPGGTGLSRTRNAAQRDR
jgi:hypothetical protein